MANYRRLISYIYAYEGGVKGKNIGYAKIEVRGEQCRIQVNVKKIYIGSNDIGVFLLAPGKEVQIGKIFIRGGSGEFRMNVFAGNVENSGYSMDQCYGLSVHDVENTWQCYTTIWEDEVAQVAEVQLAEVTVEQLRGKTAEEKVDEEYPDLLVSAEIERELAAEEHNLEMVAPWEKDQSPEQDEIKIPEFVEQKAKNEIMAFPDQTEKLKELDQMEQTENDKNQIWEQMSHKYIKVLAFEYDNGSEILSIKPQDIGLLPRDIWVYGNNSFLLHGYYNYRHIILARLNNPQGRARFLLGVPGHYFSNEKNMASMFGFPHFVLARKQPEEDGRFGYWYTDIRL